MHTQSSIEEGDSIIHVPLSVMQATYHSSSLLPVRLLQSLYMRTNGPLQRKSQKWGHPLPHARHLAIFNQSLQTPLQQPQLPGGQVRRPCVGAPRAHVRRTTAAATTDIHRTLGDLFPPRTSSIDHVNQQSGARRHQRHERVVEGRAAPKDGLPSLAARKVVGVAGIVVARRRRRRHRGSPYAGAAVVSAHGGRWDGDCGGRAPSRRWFLVRRARICCLAGWMLVQRKHAPAAHAQVVVRGERAVLPVQGPDGRRQARLSGGERLHERKAACLSGRRKEVREEAKLAAVPLYWTSGQLRFIRAALFTRVPQRKRREGSSKWRGMLCDS